MTDLNQTDEVPSDFTKGQDHDGKYWPKNLRTYKAGDRGSVTLEEEIVGVLEAWQNSVKSILELASYCKMAKDDLDTVDLKRLREKIGFGASKFSKFAKIGGDGRLWYIADRLPPDYTTLYLLAGLTDARLEQAIEKGIVCRDMERKPLEKWIAGDTSPSQAESQQEEAVRDFGMILIRPDFSSTRGAALIVRLRELVDEFPEIEIKGTRATWHVKAAQPAAPLLLAAE